MLIEKKPKYCYNDIMIQPACISEVTSRKECTLPDPLPLFTAPMDNVVGIESYELYKGCGITPILPRPVPLKTRLGNSGWSAFSLAEFKEYYCDPGTKLVNKNALIDVANGHMAVLYEAVRKAKELHPDLIVMVGNIANPRTYERANDAGVDYIRVGIGSGRGCITSTCCAIHEPMASLISETRGIKDNLRGTTKIIADGGIRGYGDIIKALALGADYVMVGSVFAKMLEAEGDVYVGTEKVNKKDLIYLGGGKFSSSEQPTKIFYGMASGKGQESICGKHTKTSEGCIRSLTVDYTMESWLENFKAYLRSTMSYLGITDLSEIYEAATCIVLTQAAQDSINK